MDPSRRDALTRSLTSLPSRRRLVAGLASIAVLLPAGLPLSARRKRKQRKPRITRNAFGCVNVGGRCTKGRHCCSGICQGKQGKKTCQAHDQSVCQAGQDFCLSEFVDCTTRAELPGLCAITTGNASYCLNVAECFPCRADTDCVPFCGAGAACLACPSCLGGGVTACAGAAPCTFPD